MTTRPPEHPTGLVPALRAQLDAAGRDRPVLTYLDPRSGERTELSAATFDNWVAKTANLLVDELAAGEGSVVAVRLPLHWQAWVWLVASWTAGCAVDAAGVGERGRDAGSADVLVTTAEGAAGAPPGPELLTLALRPFAMPGGPAPPGATDYDVAVRAYGDRWAGPAPSPAARALIGPGGAELTGAGLAAASRALASSWQVDGRVDGRDRLAVDGASAAADPLGHPGISTVLAALLAGASVVLVGGGSGAGGVLDLPRALTQENVTLLAPGWVSGQVTGSRALAHANMGGSQPTEDT